MINKAPITILAALLFSSACQKKGTCTVSGRYYDGTSQTFEVREGVDEEEFCKDVALYFDFEVVDQCYCK